jgi:hypothetical protein
MHIDPEMLGTEECKEKVPSSAHVALEATFAVSELSHNVVIYRSRHPSQQAYYMLVACHSCHSLAAAMSWNRQLCFCQVPC